MIKAARIAIWSLGLLLLLAAPAAAQETVTTLIPKQIGAGLTVIGAALGIGWLAKASVESVARQPEAAGTIQVLMIIAAALIEGLAFFAVIASM